MAGIVLFAAGVTGAQTLPDVLEGIPLRGTGPPSPMSCRDTVDAALAKDVDSAVGMFWIKGKTRQAVGILEKAVSRDPYLVRAYTTLGTWYWAQDPPQALVLLNKAVAHCPKVAILYFTRANVHSTVGNPKAALDDLVQSHILGLDNASLHYNMGNAHVKLRQYPAAIRKYEDALKRDPKHTGAWRNLVVANLDSGETSGSARARNSRCAG